MQADESAKRKTTVEDSMMGATGWHIICGWIRNKVDPNLKGCRHGLAKVRTRARNTWGGETRTPLNPHSSP
jgi:hypothetical protein